MCLRVGPCQICREPFSVFRWKINDAGFSMLEVHSSWPPHSNKPFFLSFASLVDDSRQPQDPTFGFLKIRLAADVVSSVSFNEEVLPAVDLMSSMVPRFFVIHF